MLVALDPNRKASYKVRLTVVVAVLLALVFNAPGGAALASAGTLSTWLLLLLGGSSVIGVGFIRSMHY